MKTKTALTLAAMLAFAGVAHAKFYVPKAHQACRAGYERREVRILERRPIIVRNRVEWRIVRRHHRAVRVMQARCYQLPVRTTTAPPVKTTKPTMPAPAGTPAVRYTAHVDPSFVQSQSDARAVTYTYSADATATQPDGTTTDMASSGQLPAGVLNFYSNSAPGGPESLYCSINVGGSTTSGACPIDYGDTGTYQVTTEYVPNSASAVTETDSETVSPYATTTTASAVAGTPTNNSTPITLDAAVTDPYGDSVAQGQQVAYTLTDETTAMVVESFTVAPGVAAACNVIVSVSGGGSGNATLFNSNCPGYISPISFPAADTIEITAVFGGTQGYAASASARAAFWN